MADHGLSWPTTGGATTLVGIAGTSRWLVPLSWIKHAKLDNILLPVNDRIQARTVFGARPISDRCGLLSSLSVAQKAFSPLIAKLSGSRNVSDLSMPKTGESYGVSRITM